MVFAGGWHEGGTLEVAVNLRAQELVEELSEDGAQLVSSGFRHSHTRILLYIFSALAKDDVMSHSGTQYRPSQTAQRLALAGHTNVTSILYITNHSSHQAYVSKF